MNVGSSLDLLSIRGTIIARNGRSINNGRREKSRRVSLGGLGKRLAGSLISAPFEEQ
jgi:hypothetical protein